MDDEILARDGQRRERRLEATHLCVRRRAAVALIGARAGSERVPEKNIRRLAGHPLLAYAIETARQADLFERIVVSTDSEAIAKVARWYGADAP